MSVARLKAVFFVRDFNGNPGHKEQKTSAGTGQGRRVEITFADGEVIIGTTLNYRPDGQGFFVSPSDTAANNTRIFVVSHRPPPGSFPLDRPSRAEASKAHPNCTRYPRPWESCVPERAPVAKLAACSKQC